MQLSTIKQKICILSGDVMFIKNVLRFSDACNRGRALLKGQVLRHY
jgi:hypothetical protein